MASRDMDQWAVAVAVSCEKAGANIIFKKN
jgi:hypothetical protein